MSLGIEFLPRFFRPPARSFFLFGPRGTGKSLWAERSFPDSLRIDLLDPETARTYAARAFREDYPAARCVLLYPGGERLRIDGVLCMDVSEFLRNLRPGDLSSGLGES